MPAIVTHARAADFLERAQSWLVEKEAENNLILSVARGVAEQGACSEK